LFTACRFELVNFICDAIEHLEREAYIEQVRNAPLFVSKSLLQEVGNKLLCSFELGEFHL